MLGVLFFNIIYYMLIYIYFVMVFIFMKFFIHFFTTLNNIMSDSQANLESARMKWHRALLHLMKIKNNEKVVESKTYKNYFSSSVKAIFTKKKVF